MTKQTCLAAKRVARVCNGIQLPLLLIWSVSVVVLAIAAFCGARRLGVAAAITLAISMAVVLTAILIEAWLVYATFDRVNRTWTTAWGHTFCEDHMPGKVLRR